MKKIDIENKAVSILMKLFSDIDGLNARFSTNDKTISKDGVIEVYMKDMGEYCKKGYLGEVSVQIKGTTSRISRKKGYNIEVADLKIYKDSGGVLFLVVDVEREEIFYASLLPIKSQEKLSLTHEGQKTKSVKLSKLPINRDQIYFLCRNFLTESKAQYSFQGEVLGMDNLDQANLSSFSSKLTFTQDDKGYVLSGDSEVFYANLKNGQMVPVEKVIIDEINLHEEFTFQNGKDLDLKRIGKVSFSKSSDRHRVCFDDLLTLYLYRDIKNLVYSLKGDIHQIVSTLELLIYIGTGDVISWNLGVFSIKLDEDTYNQLKEMYNQFCEIIQLLDFWRISKPIILESFTYSDIQFLLRLKREIIDNIYIEKANKDGGFKFFQLGVLKLLLLKGNHLGKTQYIDFFAPNIKLVSDNLPNIDFPSWILLEKEHFLSVDNLNYNQILSYIDDMSMGTEHLASFNNLLLEAIKAYDIKPIDGLKKVISKLSKRLYELSRDDSIAIINLLQVKYRFQSLNNDDEIILDDIKTKSDILEIKVACDILLGNKNEICKGLNQMSKSQLSRFKEYPIYNLVEPE